MNSEIDQESGTASVSDPNNNEATLTTTSDNLTKGIEGKVQQMLIRGDRVFALSEPSAWNLSRRKEVFFVPGTVVLNKEQTLSIRWADGKWDNLNTKSNLIAYGERTFVLDREFIDPGSRVYLSDHRETVGTVTAKRVLATVSCVKSPDVYFHDIDASTLRRYQTAHVHKDNKILYQNEWVGITSGYRTRVHFRTEDGNEFSLLCDEVTSEAYYVGQEIKIGLSLLWNLEWSEDSANWVTNAFKYYNESAVVFNMELEEMDAYWFAKVASTSKAARTMNPFNMCSSPDKIIMKEGLSEVQYLVGDEHHHMNPGSYWVYRTDSRDNPITKEKWVSMWLKVMDWERWEYPVPQDVANPLKYLNQEMVVQIKYVRAVVDVAWDNGTTCTLNAADVVPSQVGSMWLDFFRLVPGVIVGDRLDVRNRKKYGIVTKVDDQLNASVKWILPGLHDEECQECDIRDSTYPFYDLFASNEYEYLSRVNQCPLVFLKSYEGPTNVGVVAGLNYETGQVCVKMASGETDHLWPHELVHYKCDIIFCPKDGMWMTWYEHIRPPPSSSLAQVVPITIPSDYDAQTPSDDNVSIKSTRSVCLDLSLAVKKKVDHLHNVPEDNIFADEEMLPRLRETHFRRAINDEIQEMERNLPDGMWVEYYINRADILSVVVEGPKSTLFEDALFIFDIFLLEDYPNSEPHLNFRSFGITLFPRHLCQSGAVFLPENPRLVDACYTFSFILNLLLELKDFMSLPLDEVLENDLKNSSNHPIVTCREGSQDLQKFLLLSVLDYTIAILRNPPGNWSSVISHHFAEALPKMIERCNGANSFQFKRDTAAVSNDQGDLPVVDDFELVSFPWSESYKNSVQSRVNILKTILYSLNPDLKVAD